MSKKNNKLQNYDVVIIGGGMVGASQAAALAHLPIQICVVDAGPGKSHWSPEVYDLRVSAITRASQNVFINTGVWQGIENRRVQPYEEMHVWDATGDGSIDFYAEDIGEPNLGHIIENSVIVGALLDVLKQHDNVNYLSHSKPTALEVSDTSVQVSLDSGQTLDAKLIIGADGARSWVREQLKIETEGWSYGQKGLVTTVKMSAEKTPGAWQRFLPSGPLAFLPVSSDEYSIVWTTAEAAADHLLTLDDAAFIAALNEALGSSEIGEVINVAQRAAFPLRLQHSKTYCKSRVVLVGDAAHTIHPLAGQGVNLGLMDVADLTQILERAHSKHQDIGVYSLLRKYERKRKGRNLLTMFSMDGFKRLFCNTDQPWVAIRNSGLSLTHKLNPLKNKIIRQAMGLTDDFPKLTKNPE